MRRRVLRCVGIVSGLLLILVGLAVQPVPVQAAAIYVTTQQFERGLMIFRNDNTDVWILLNSQQAYKYSASYYNQFSDQTPVNNPSNRLTPMFSFGKVWRNIAQIRDALGWPTLPEIGFNANVSNYRVGSVAVVEFPQLNGKVMVAYRAPSGYAWYYNTTITSANVTATQAAFQTFDNGYMIWRADTQDVLVFPGKTAGQASFYPVAAYGAWPDNQVTDVPPAGHIKPVNAFGRVWSRLWLDNARYMGWPTGPEQRYSAIVTQSPVVSNEHTPFVMSFSITIPDGRKINISSGYSYTNWDIR